MRLIILIISLFISFNIPVVAQQTDTSSTPTLNKKRLITVASVETGICAGTLLGLNQLWYANYPQSSLHIFNDNDEWMQMDKVGHFFVSHKVGKYGFQVLQWAGLERNKSLIYGGTLGLVFLTGVEILDGFSSEWGFSPGDMIANIGGTSFFLGQQLLWKEQKINMKVSFHYSPYAKIRPNVLGSNYPERILKDYNGQIYWLSVPIGSFIKTGKLPKWLCIAAGYGADGMIGGSSNPIVDKNGNPYPTFERYRQYYLSLDVDLTKIKTKSKTLRYILNTIAFIKFPLPALEYNRVNKLTFSRLYF